MTTDDTTAGLGHNRPPLYDSDRFAELAELTRKRCDDIGAWLDLKSIDDETQASKLKDQIDGLKALRKEIEAQRKADKEPHLEAGREVDRVWKDVDRPLEIGLKKLADLMNDYVRRKEAEAAAERRRREEEARRAEAEAREKAEAAERRNDVIGAAEAERAAAEAEERARAAAEAEKVRIESFTGGGRASGVRSYFSARVVSRRLAFLTLDQEGYGERLDEMLAQLGSDLARKTRGERDLPGFEVTEDRRVA